MRLQAGSLLTLGQSQWKAEKSGDQDTEGHLLLSGHTDTQISDVLHEQTHGSRTAHSLCLLSTAIQSPGPRGGGRSEGVSGREATMINSGAIAEEFALTVTQNHHRGRIMDHLQRAGLSAARCHVHSGVHRPTGPRVSATCTSNGDVCPPSRIMHAMCTQRS